MAVNILHSAVITGSLKVGSEIRDTTDTDTGFDLPGGNAINIVCGNTTRASITSTAMNVEVPAVMNSTLELNNGLIDINQSQGTAGQILTSLGAGNGVRWGDASGGGGTMDDWLLDTDVATGWPDTIGDGEKVEILGGTCIQTAGTNPSVGVSRVTINQTSYFDTKALATAWKVGTTGTAFLSFTDGLSQTSLGYDNAMVIPSDGHLRSIIVMTDVTQTGFTFSLVNQGGSNIYVSSSQSLTANVATTITPGSAAITKSSDKTVHFKMVRATSASNNASIIVTLVFEWDI